MKCHFLIIGVLIVDLHFCILKYTSAELLARRQTIYNLLRAALKEDRVIHLTVVSFCSYRSPYADSSVSTVLRQLVSRLYS